MKKRVEQWLHFAQIDIESAKALNEKEYLTQTAAFHCHQAVEKLLKSLIENQEENVPRIHNLEVLFGILENRISLPIDEEVLVQINEVYIDTRYPSDAGLIPKGRPYFLKLKDSGAEKKSTDGEEKTGESCKPHCQE